MEIDLNTAIYPNILLFKIMGHWPCGNKKLYNVYKCLVMTSMIVYNVTSLLYLIKNLDDTEQVTSTIYNLLSTMAVLIKARIFHKNWELVKDIVKTFEDEEFQPKTEEQKNLLKSGIFIAKFIFYYFLLTAVAALAMWVLFPVLDNERRLPSNAWFPYNYLSSKYYTITYVWQSITICYHGLSNVSMDTLFAMLMTQTGAQCDILNNQVSNLGKENYQNEETVLKELHISINHHRIILQLARNIRKAFGNIVFVQFATSVSVLCETMFLLSLITVFNATYVTILLYQIAIFTQIFLYCWFGNEVVLKSGKLFYSAYASNWYECPNSVKKDLLFFMHRAQRPIILFVGNMFPISLSTFTSILRTSWAYFMALRKVHEKNALTGK